MTEPGDQRTPAADGRSRFRASHADREQAVEVLKVAFVQGRLDKDELDARVGQAFASRTYAELAAVTADITADIPAGPTAAPPSREPARTQNAQHRAKGSHTARDVTIGLVLGLIVAAVIVFGGLLQYVAFGMFGLPVLAVLPLVRLANWSQQPRSRGQLPPRPGQDGQAPEVQAPGQASHDPLPPPDRPDQARADLRTDSSRPGGSHVSGRGARTPRGMRPVTDAV